MLYIKAKCSSKWMLRIFIFCALFFLRSIQVEVHVARRRAGAAITVVVVFMAVGVVE